MKTIPQKNEASNESGLRASSRRAEAWHALPRVFLTGLAALLALSPMGLGGLRGLDGVRGLDGLRGLDAGVAAAVVRPARRGCQKVVLRGEVAAGKEWRSAIGEGWVFRVLPITAASADGLAGHRFTGWDLVMDREKGAGYPDALLLATPPYGSVNEREIGTTFGMRAQDAIAWEPRKFHFFTSMDRVAGARSLFGQMFSSAPKGAVSEALREAKAQQVAGASLDLLNLISSDPEMGYGRFSITDARLVSGVGDPPAFARVWTGHLGQVPHTLEQASPKGAGRSVAGMGFAAGELGELRWIQFVATLWLPGEWKVPAGLRPETANCAE
jgi:hypothetical protein